MIGRLIAGKFAVEERLGAGAMGIVYRATQIALERPVALKVLHREFVADSEFAERFWREAKAASRLDHPNSIRVLDFGQESDGLLYLVMEYVEGSDLFEWLSQRRPVAPRTIVEILSQVLAALAVAHDMSVVHRDLKPENIMVVRGMSDDGRAIDIVKVCDFGIAKFLDTSRSSQEERRKHSTTGLVVGTPAYMSPEQARGEKQDVRSDLYAVGVILYELLTGRVPFEAETLIGVALKHVSEMPQPPSARAAGVDPTLEAICLKAMSKKPADRYQTAREMRVALLQAAQSAGFGLDLSPSPSGSMLLLGSRRQDSSKPTLAGITPGTPAPIVRRSRAWFALLLLPALGGVAFVRYRPASNAEHANVEAALVGSGLPTPSSASSAAIEAEPVAPVDSSDEAPVNSPHAGPAGRHHRHANGDSASRATVTPDQVDLDSTPAPAAPPAAPAPVAPTPSPALDTPPPAPAPAPVEPSAPVSDPARASISIGTARNAIGATAISVTRAVSPALARITACYKSALPGLGSAFEGTDTLHIETDGAGMITGARLSGPIRGSIAACIAGAVQGRRVANVDTGMASADVPLSFRDH
ncbi:MAG TPA: protein kinase [Polyangiaceae bacterium]|jgi:serine/threonine-protein kinase